MFNHKIGKSYLVQEYGKTHFKKFIEINLYEHKEWIPVLEQAKNAKDLLFRISPFIDEELVEGETLIFLMRFSMLKNVI